MTRQEKYPETKTFHYYNANPKNKITTDCVIRALCTGLDMDYKELYLDIVQFSLTSGYHIDDKQCYKKYLESKGYVMRLQPRKNDNTKYTGEEFCKRLADPNKRYLAHIGGHHIVAIVNKKVYDIWDSTDGCIGNYWVIE